MFIKTKLSKQFDIIEEGLRKAFSKPTIQELNEDELLDVMDNHDCKQEKCEVCLEWQKRKGRKKLDDAEAQSDLERGN